MLPTKLTLSAEERLLMMDTRFILTKNAVLKKVELLFGAVSETIRQRVTDLGMEEVGLFVLSPKIARGEQYQNLPWVMLDYPRIFTKTDTCAIRCFFWWGNYCTITLQLAGLYFNQYKPQVEAFVKQHVEEGDWYLSVGENQWQHQLEPTAYRKADSIDETYWSGERPFIKLVKKIPLEQWDELFPLMENNIVALLNILTTNQAPSL
jgi:hypothetical protein